MATKLTQAIAHRASIQVRVSASRERLEAVQATESTLKDEALAAAVREQENTLPAEAVSLATARLNADARADAATRATARVRHDLEAAETDLRSAQEAVDDAARAEVAAEIRKKFGTLREIASAYVELRNSLLGDYLAMPAALTDREWVELDAPRGYAKAAALKVGLPMVGVSIYESDALGDSRAGRAAVNESQRRCLARIAQLKRDAEAATSEEAAAA